MRTNIPQMIEDDDANMTESERTDPVRLPRG
jgi:hypothetical protein